MEVVRRSEGSIERKLQNVSAVMDVLGAQWINGYKPLAHYQDALVEAVARAVAREPRFLDPGSVGTPPTRNETAILVPAPVLRDRDETLTPAVRRLVGKFDPAERDARNRDLGKAGERFVVEFERDRLLRAGRDELAGDVRWVSDLDGDAPAASPMAAIRDGSISMASRIFSSMKSIRSRTKAENSVRRGVMICSVRFRSGAYSRRRFHMGLSRSRCGTIC
jgi:hypothetical protein